MVLSKDSKLFIIKSYYGGLSVREIRNTLLGLAEDNEHVPSVSAIKLLVKKFENTLCIADGHNRKTRTVTNNEEFEYNVLLHITENKELSIRSLARILNCNRSKIARVLKKYKYKPFKKHYHQELFPRDLNSRIEFCENMMDRIHRNPNFLRYICFSDESTFYVKNNPNRQNDRVWDVINPHAIEENQTQYQIKCNVWLGIISRFLIGPFFIGQINQESYLNLLQEQVGPALLEKLGEQELFFQHDGCPAHSSVQVCI